MTTADQRAVDADPAAAETPASDGLPPGGQEWVIAAAGHEARVIQVGAALRTYTVDGVDLLDGHPADELPKGCRGQVLAPWANRIRDGRYTFAGQDHQLDIGEVATNTAFHGLVRWAAWRPELHESDSITLTTTVSARDGYPFTVRLGVRYSVGADGLTVEHTARNLSGRPAPFMLATHCYPTIPGTRVDELSITVPADVWVPTDDRLLPLPTESVAGDPHDLRDGPVFGDRVIDNAYGELHRGSDGLVRVVIGARDGRGVQLWADGSFDWLQVYSSDTMTGELFRRSFAVEPMTGPPDCFRSGVDLVVLEPGEQWRGRWGIAPASVSDAGTRTSGSESLAEEPDDASGTGSSVAEGAGRTAMGPPVTGTAADLLPEVTRDEAEIRREDPSLAEYAAGGDDERILREVPPHHVG